MSKPITYSKRDNEKKKQEKRLEKNKKKEERKQSETSSFEDMIAYVDENGVISSNPPQIKSKPKNEPTLQIINDNMEKSKTSEIKGRVEHLNTEKGYGFIKELSGTNKYFFHVSGLIDAVQTGDSVFFDLERGKKGLNAVNVRKSDVVV